MSDFDLDHLRRLVVERRLSVYDWSASERIQKTPTVFFDKPWNSDDDTPAIPHALLDERKRLVDAHLGTREWYFVTECGPSEFTEELRDYGILIVVVDDVEAARKELPMNDRTDREPL